MLENEENELLRASRSMNELVLATSVFVERAQAGRKEHNKSLRRGFCFFGLQCSELSVLSCYMYHRDTAFRLFVFAENIERTHAEEGCLRIGAEMCL